MTKKTESEMPKFRYRVSIEDFERGELTIRAAMGIRAALILAAEACGVNALETKEGERKLFEE